jgi:hypothetical protein
VASLRGVAAGRDWLAGTISTKAVSKVVDILLTALRYRQGGAAKSVAINNSATNSIVPSRRYG